MNDCPKTVKYRGLCHAHYQKFYRTGELDIYADAPKEGQHRLSNINTTTRTADCKSCGADSKIVRSGSKWWSCHTPVREYNRASRPNKYYFGDGDYIDAAEAVAARERFYIEQEGRCAICKRTEDELGYALHLDHCHTTGKLRGLLCIDCNLGISKFRDSSEILIAASEYVTR